MSVLIKGMDMPKNCWECRVSTLTRNSDVLVCALLNDKKMLREDVLNCRYVNCPLTEIESEE